MQQNRPPHVMLATHKRVGGQLLEWAVDRIAACGKRFARLDTVAKSTALCRYYEERGFRPLETVTPFGGGSVAGSYAARLFEKELTWRD